MKVSYRGWAGHFCGAFDCLFRLNTLIECKDRKIIVSTVGAYRPYRDRPIDEIGVGRYYETMVFESDYTPPYFDADIQNQLCQFTRCYDGKDDLLAQQGHEAVVQEVCDYLNTL